MPAGSLKNFDKLKALEASAQGGKGGKRRERTQLGHHKVSFGYAVSGLRDILLAFGLLDEKSLGLKQAFKRADAFEQGLKALIGKAAVLSEDPAELARCAEALRVYARDVQLSRAHAEELPATLQASMSCFDKALEVLEKNEGPSDQIAWCRAHRGACRMMMYWLGLVSDSPPAKSDELFKACEADFRQAIVDAGGEYTWCIQFSAFLHALRGQGDDFNKAVMMLANLGDALTEPTIQRSIAMLLSYNAAESALPAEVRTEAAKRSIDAAMNAQKADQDEFLGPYSGAVSRWALFDMKLKEFQGKSELSDSEKRELDDLAQDARMACETAEIRARNAMSQALVALAGLTFVRGRLASAQGDSNELEDAVQESKELQKLIDDAEFRDIESRAMVYRDPVWRAMASDNNCHDVFKSPGYEILRLFSRDKKPAAGKKRIVRAI